MQALAQSFEQLGYTATTMENLSARELGAAVRTAIDQAQDSDVMVFHIFSHGYLTRSGSLRVIGADGEHHDATDVGEWLKKVVDAEANSPMTLFLLDVCHGGRVARLFWQPEINDEDSRAWVIAAAAPDEQAYEGRFTDAVIAVLRDLADGRLDIDQSYRYAPIDTMAQQIRRDVVRRAAAAGAYVQRVTASRVDISATLPSLPFFPNKRYSDNLRRRARTRIDAAVMPFLDDLDEALDPAHFLARAAGQGVLTSNELTGCFSGRRRELRILSPWLNLQDDVGLRIVTGSPGAGKSALIGVLVCAAHPALRESTRAVWEVVEQAPYPNHNLAAVHARERTLSQIVVSVARQLRLLPEVKEPSAVELIAAVTTMPNPPVIIVDALDEATDASGIMTRLLLPLSRVSRADTEPIRLLIGMRPWQEFEPLLNAAAEVGGVVDLDETENRLLSRDVGAYVLNLLLSDRRWDQLEYVGPAQTLARVVADTLTGDTANRQWGAFLVAGLFTGYVLNTFASPIGDQTEAIRVGAGVPRTLPELLELDLRTRATDPWVRPLLTALAHAKGDGMPARPLGYVASALFDGGPPDTRHVLDALDMVRFYLRHGAAIDGTAVYRLFHQGLADHLRQSADGGSVLDGLLDSVVSVEATTAGVESVRHWDLAEPYLVRHVAQHAAQAGRLHEVMTDVGFLVAADPASVLAELDGGPGGDLPQLTVDAYRQAVADSFVTGDRLQRLQLLAMSAVRCGASQITQAVAALPAVASLAWQPLWVVSEKPHGEVTAVATHPGPNRSTAVLGMTDGSLVVRDLASGDVLWEESNVHASSISAAALISVDSQYAVLSIDVDGTLLRHPFGDHEHRPISVGTATGVSAGVLSGRPVAIVVGESGEAAIWDVRSGGRLARLDMRAELSECFTVGDVPARIVGLVNEPHKLLILVRGAERAVLLHGEPIVAAAAGAVGNALGSVPQIMRGDHG